MDKNQAAQQTLELRDIHMPDAPSYWPLAPGWWFLIIIVCVLAYLLYKIIAKRNHRKQLNNLMQNQLQTIQSDYKKHKNKHKLAIEVSELLNRFVRHVLGDSNATSLSGKAWINYLNSQTEHSMFDKFEVELTQAQYMKDIDYDVPSLIATVKNYFPLAIKGIKNA